MKHNSIWNKEEHKKDDDDGTFGRAQAESKPTSPAQQCTPSTLAGNDEEEEGFDGKKDQFDIMKKKKGLTEK